MQHSDFWAKTCSDGTPGIDVRGHCYNVAYVAFELAKRFAGTLKQLGITPELVAFLAGTHDCGKISFSFQKLCPEWMKKQNLTFTGKAVPHSITSRDALIRFLLRKGVATPESAVLWASVIGAHHGRLAQLPGVSSRGPKVNDRGRGEPDWEMWRQDLLEDLAIAFNIQQLPEVDDEEASLWYLGGLISLADWIASDESFFPVEKALPEEEAKERARKAIDALQIYPLSVLADVSFENVFGFAPNIFQKYVLELVTGPGLYIFEAPMGMGKTEAAFWASWQLLAQKRASGIYFALPTQVTSNRIWLRMKAFSEQVCPCALSPRIIHGGAWLEEGSSLRTVRSLSEESETAAERWFCSSRRALFAPLGVGTIDQALMSVLAVKYFFMRRFALAGKVVILDEVHSYDAYTGELVVQLCRELVRLGATVIILSATLTDKARARLLGEEEGLASSTLPIRLTARPLDGEPVCITANTDAGKAIRVEWATRQELIEKMEQAALEGACVLWICDTVDAAQETCRIFLERNVVAPKDIGLLHSRFPRFQRTDIESVWLERLGKMQGNRVGSILISTQIVEQSVDIDADILVTELAPTDMLLQRLGRLQRHDRGRRKWTAQCWLIRENVTSEETMRMSPDAIRKALGAKSWVYRPDILLRTLRVWEQVQEVHLPSEIRTLLERTYDENDLPDVWQELANESEGKDCADRFLARRGTSIWGMTMSDSEEIQTLSTRLSSYETKEYVLCLDISEHSLTLLNGDSVLLEQKKLSWGDRKALAENSVRLPVHKVSLAKEITIARELYTVVRVKTEANGNEEKALRYSPKMGVQFPHGGKEF